MTALILNSLQHLYNHPPDSTFYFFNSESTNLITNNTNQNDNINKNNNTEEPEQQADPVDIDSDNSSTATTTKQSSPIRNSLIDDDSNGRPECGRNGELESSNQTQGRFFRQTFTEQSRHGEVTERSIADDVFDRSTENSNIKKQVSEYIGRKRRRDLSYDNLLEKSDQPRTCTTPTDQSTPNKLQRIPSGEHSSSSTTTGSATSSTNSRVFRDDHPDWMTRPMRLLNPSSISSSKAPTIGNKLMKYLIENRICNQTMFDEAPLAEREQYLTHPSLNQLLATGFRTVSQMVIGTPFDYFERLTQDEVKQIKYEIKYEPDKIFQTNSIYQLLEYQNLSTDQIILFGTILPQILNKRPAKKNCVWIHGKSNCGKTILIQSFLDSFYKDNYGVPNNDPRSSFPFNDCCNKRIIFWDEPNITPQNIENVKLLLGGQNMPCEIKYRNSQFLRRTPVLIASNQPPGHNTCDASIINNRCFVFKFSQLLPDATFAPELSSSDSSSNEQPPLSQLKQDSNNSNSHKRFFADRYSWAQFFYHCAQVEECLRT